MDAGESAWDKDIQGRYCITEKGIAKIYDEVEKTHCGKNDENFGYR